MSWISVKDKLPKKGIEVFVAVALQTSDGEFYYSTDVWNDQYECPVSWSTQSICTGEGWENNEIDEVLYWMSIPKIERNENESR